MACLPSIVLSIPFLWNFRPEMPHIGYCLDMAGYSLLAFLTSTLTDAARVHKTDQMSVASRIRRLEESIKDWRSILFVSATTYMVLAIYWLQLVWMMARQTVQDDGEQWLFGTTISVKLVVLSFFVLVGPIAAIFRALKTQQDELAELST